MKGRLLITITPTCNDADDFLRFFDEKVKAVRASTDGQQLPTSTTPPVDVSLSYCYRVVKRKSVDSSCSQKKVKEADLYSAFIKVPYTQGAQVRITQCYLQITP